MDQTQIIDKLLFHEDKAINKLIKQEQILFSDKVIKINRHGSSQERNLLITDKAIYNLKKKSKNYLILNINL
jgi:16S rRNA U516 pseudouridylate synthase RsuA-like enzyme